MSREISQEPSYQFLVDPTPDNPFSKSDYLDAANNDSVYLRNDYPFEWVEDDLTALFPDKLPKDWAEKYFHWWMEQRRMEVIDVDPSFYEAVNREQWNGDWALRSPYRVNAVRVTLGKTTAWLKKREFEEIVRVEGFYPLGGLAVNSWDEILEIAATAPALLDKISLGPPHSITQEKIDLYLKQMERELSRVADPPEGFLRSASLPQGEMQLKVRTQRAERVKLSAGGGWVALDYEAGATVQGYFNLQAGRAAVPDGTYLFSFKGVSISLRPEQIVDLIQKRDGAGFSPLLSKISSVVKAVVGDTKDYYRLPAVGIIVSGGRPQLEIDLASHPLIRKTLNLPPDKDSHILLHIDLSLAGDFGAPGFAGDWVGDPSVRFQSDLNSDLLLKMAEEIMQSVQQSGGGGGLFASILPSSYSGEIKLRSVNGGYVLDLPHPLLGEEAKVAGGALKLDFDSRGITSAEGRLPVYFLRNAGDEEGRTASATVDFRVADDETGRYRGWLEVHSDELPAFIGGASGSAEANVFFSDLELNRGATGLNDLIGRMVNEFEVRMTQNGSESVLVQGGGIYTHEDTQVYLSGDGNVLSLPGVSVDRNPVAVSWNGVPGVPGKNFELSGFSFELMEGVRFEIEDVVGSYAKNSDETIANVKGVFQFTADGPFVAERRVIYEGEIVWNPKQQTFTIADLDIPLPDLALAFRQGDEKFPFVFSGELTGTIQADLRRSSVTGPFALSGDLFYDADIRESGMLILPQWLRVKGPFLAGASYRGVVYRPGERHQLKEAGEVVQNSGNTNRVRSIKGVEFQVNSLRRDKGGAVLADLQINLDGIHLLSEEMIPPYSAKVEFEAETADGKNGEDSPSGLVVRSRPFGLNDEDTHLDRYGLDNEKAEMMRDIIHNSEEANFSLTGFKIKNTGSPFFYVPHNAVPRIDVRVRNGLIDRFHLYFSQPVGIPPVIRGVYFDKWAGKFRLDWLNHGDGERRIVNGNEPEITKMLFGLIPLPEEEIDRLASRAALDPDFVTDDASVWLEFFISTLVALDRDAFRRREKPKEGYPVEMDRAKLFIDSLRLKPGTALSLYETEFEVACDHASEADEGAHEGDNLISGVVDIGSGVLRMKMDSVDRLHIVMPGENGDNLVDLMLRDGSIGEIEMRKDNGASILKISDMNFARANLDGKLFKDKVKLQVISNLRMNEMEIREGGVDDADQTVVFADFNAELEKGYIRFQKGERKAHFDMGPSPIHVKSLFKFDEVVRDQPSAGGKKDSHPGHQPRRQTVDTVLASTEFDITSDRLAFSRVNLSPGIVFDRAVTHNAHIVLKNGPGGEGEELNLTGRFDWEMGQSFTVPLAEVRLIPRLTPELTFDSMTVKGPGQLLFEDERVFFGTIREGEKIPMALKEGTLRVGYAGALSMRHVPLPSMPEYVTDLKGRFQGSTEYRTGRFFLDENGVILPLHVEEMSADVVFIRFFDLNGKVYVESPSPEGVSGWSFVNGKGQFSAVSARIKEAGWAQYEGAQLQLYDQGPHRNSVMMQGNLEVRNKVFVFDNLDLEADLYDEVNDVWMRGIKIKSQSSPLATLFALPPTALATGYRKSSSEE